MIWTFIKQAFILVLLTFLGSAEHAQNINPHKIITSDINAESIIMIESLAQITTILSLGSDQINENFTMHQQGISPLSCKMPSLYIVEETQNDHGSYELITVGVEIVQIHSKYWQISADIKCELGSCIANMNNLCEQHQGHGINWIIVEMSERQYDFQYLVNCQSDVFYKPFEWGLFILICVCTLTITLSSLYSRAWSYGGFGLNITINFLIAFNVLVIIGSILAYYIPSATSVAMKIIGSLVGVIGVGICTSQTLWLAKSQKLNKAFKFGVRPLDIISYVLGIIIMILYWTLNGAWLINDILAICTIVASIKIFKVRSMKIGVIMLISLLLIQITVGLMVHYILKVSYNNLIIQMFQSPLVIVFPSITPELYRKCAWLPVTSIIFPGIFISYLRRFDKSRGTLLYIILGYISFYIGSILWMICDLSTQHSLPLAIISDPVVIIIVLFLGNRRNELETLWTGMFFDPELPDFSEDILLPDRYSNIDETGGKKNTPSRYTIGFKQMTDDLKINQMSSEEI